MSSSAESWGSEAEFFSETPAQATKRIMEESSVFAAQAISDLATDDMVSPSVRLRAAQYIVDRNLGPIGSSADNKQDALEAFLEELQKTANS